MKNEFDELLQQQYEKGEFEYSPAQWDRMAATLATEEKPANKKGIWFWLPALALAASLGLFLMLTVNKDNGEPQKATAATTTTTNIDHPATLSVEDEKSQDAAIIDIASSGRTVAGPANSKHLPIVKNSIAITKEPLPNNIVTPKTNPLVAPNADKKTEYKTPVNLARTEEKDLRRINLGDPDLFERKTTTRTSLALAGGVNYGSMNTGYTVGVNARRQVYGQFYVESDVALVNNSIAFSGISTTTTSTPPATISALDVKNSFTTSATANSNTGQPVTLGVPSGEEVKSTVTTNTSTPGDLFYVQVTPSVGYRLSSAVSLSVGADMQRLLNNNNNSNGEPAMAFAANNEEKKVPGFDFGLMGKTEVSLSKTLKAGIQYRKAMNDVVRGNSKYLDRSYMQVQLKFIILNK